jgi:hypothetical protein
MLCGPCALGPHVDVSAALPMVAAALDRPRRRRRTGGPVGGVHPQCGRPHVQPRSTGWRTPVPTAMDGSSASVSRWGHQAASGADVAPSLGRSRVHAAHSSSHRSAPDAMDRSIVPSQLERIAGASVVPVDPSVPVRLPQIAGLGSNACAGIRLGVEATQHHALAARQMPVRHRTVGRVAHLH